MLFYAGALLVTFLSRADLTLKDFDGRTISQATLDGVSIASRTALYPSAIAVFLGACVVGIVVLPTLSRWMSAPTRRLLETSSIGGLILLFLATYKSFAPDSLRLLVGFQALVFFTPLLERWIARQEFELDRTAYLAWLVTTAVCLCFPWFDWLRTRFPELLSRLSLLAIAFAFTLHVLVCVVARTRRRGAGSTRVERLVWASMPVCLVPATSVLSIELYLLLNNAEVARAPGPLAIQTLMCAALGTWAVARAWRFDAGDATGGAQRIERLLGARMFPLALCGVGAFLLYRPFLLPDPELLEAANPGLAIQQWFDFGRWPFLQTFNAHGLSELLCGLVYTWITGFRDEIWHFYNFVGPVLNALLTYFVLAHVTRSIYLAIFSLIFLPYLDALFPGFCVLALVSVFMLRWVLVRDDLRAWFLFFLYLVLAVLWRIDSGVATVAASIATLFACRWSSAEGRWSLARAAGGALLALAASLAIVVTLALLKDVPIGPLARDWINILNSNQGFGYSHLARQRNDVFVWHHFLIPVLVFLVGCLGWLRWRGQLRIREERAYVFLALAFMSAFYFAFFPRGLVRHSFMEIGNVVVSSFAFAILALAVYGLTRAPPRLSYAVFVFVSSTLAYNFSLSGPAGKLVDERTGWYETISQRATRFPTITPSPQVIDRSLITERFKQRHTGAILAFLQANLEPEQTFLDLSNNPMLYVFARRRSPHYLNHLLIAHNDYLQERVLEELQRFDVPLVLLTTEPSLCAADHAQDFSHLDNVPFRLRQYRLHEYVYAHYQPLCLVQRWHVWARRDWTMRAAPVGADRKVHWSLDDTPQLAATQDGEVRLGEMAVRGLGVPTDRVLTLPDVQLPPDRAFYLRVSGASPRGGTLELSWRTQDEHGARNESRMLAWPAGTEERFFVLPPRLAACRLDRLVIDGARAPELTLDGFELVSMASTPYTSISAPALAPVSDELRFLPYIWGRYDAERAARVIVRDLVGGSAEMAPQAIDAEAARTFVFDPIERWDPACYVVVRMRTLSANTDRVVVEYGEDETHCGRFVFQPARDRDEHEYVVRASVQYDWNANPKNRITVTPRGGGIELVGLAIARGD